MPFRKYDHSLDNAHAPSELLVSPMESELSELDLAHLEQLESGEDAEDEDETGLGPTTLEKVIEQVCKCHAVHNGNVHHFNATSRARMCTLRPRPLLSGIWRPAWASGPWVPLRKRTKQPWSP